MGSEIGMVDRTLDKWLPLSKECPAVDFRLATHEEAERLDKSLLSKLAVFLGAKTAAYYTHADHTGRLTPALGTETFNEIVSAINHEMLHHILTTFIDGKTSHKMDNLIECDDRREVGKAGSVLTFRNKLDLEVSE